MPEEISFEPAPEQKPVPPVKDPAKAATTSQVIQKIEREQIEKQIRKDAGLDTEKKHAPIPKDIPIVIFRFGAKTIKCPAFALDDSEADLMAKHLSIICEHFNISGVWFSVFVVVVVIISKLVQCKDAVFSTFSAIMGKFRKKEDDPNENKTQ